MPLLWYWLSLTFHAYIADRLLDSLGQRSSLKLVQRVSYLRQGRADQVLGEKSVVVHLIDPYLDPQPFKGLADGLFELREGSRHLPCSRQMKGHLLQLAQLKNKPKNSRSHSYFYNMESPQSPSPQKSRSEESVNTFNTFAQPYEEKFMDQSLYHKGFDRFLGLLRTGKTSVLDVACGPGNITHYLLKKRPELNILGLDLAPNMLELAKANNPLAQFRLMDTRKIGNLGSTYDGIICGFGLPYLSQEEAISFIEDAYQLLNPGGALYLSTMEDEYSKSGYKKPSSGGSEWAYIYYHQAKTLSPALEKVGFTDIEVQRQEFPGDSETPVIDLILIAQKP